ncbi:MULTISPECIES: DUF2163 domain-containing protein [Sphingomonas]|uniref:Bacteriophage phiJL001 Gp84 C-terminal domain-containing protein n=2 Tax=Sphingomonas adhaesiva TaxID=28212 RepID=A0A2A4I9S6_9SPHN|nr:MULTISPECIES: DUF2163 domain-containing protein [Sphingomonas]PCG14533.1 hypothetical protein COA07_08385 [Sphingomonas adhaesiva]PZU75272.1 MAG: DUF2163 domain-containing protein [Sphingomonas sp.]
MSAGASQPDRVTTLALCWRIERSDGVTVALTDHDRDLTVAGVRYRAAPGMTPSAIERAEGADPDTMTARGALDVAAITARDLAAGRWDAARVVTVAIDWDDLAAAPIALGEGRIGEVSWQDGAFAADLRGATARLEGPVTEATSPACRASLGDRRCRVAMAGRRQFARVVAAAGEVVTLDRAEPSDNGWGEGVLRWFGGANTGLRSAIARSAGAEVTLRMAPPFAIEAGTLVEVSEGCDRRIATCAARFGNAANFRGEPYLPGIDLLTRYPGT